MIALKKGAMQIGKTESINHFANQNYGNIVSINFVLEPKYKTILSDGYAVEDIRYDRNLEADSNGLRRGY